MRQSALAVTAVAMFLSSLCFVGEGLAQDMVFPGEDWERATPESQLVNSAVLEAAVRCFEGESPFGGDGVEELAIIRNGRMIWEGPNIDRMHYVWSVTKSYTSTVLGLLIDDGRATLDTLAMDYVPDLAADYPDVTLRHFTTMTSGYHAADESSPGYWTWTPFIPREPFFTPPGSEWFYSNPAMEQFSNVLTQIAEEPIEDLFWRRIADPIGVDPNNWNWLDWENDIPQGPNPPGSVAAVNTGSMRIYTTAQDAARFGHLLLNRGQWDGEQLISAAWVDEATSVQVPANVPLYPQDTTSEGGPGYYGYNWWVNGTNSEGVRYFPGATADTYCASGLGNNKIVVIPEWDMVVVRLATDEPSVEPRIPGSTWGAFLGLIGIAVGSNTGPVTWALSPDLIYTAIDNDDDLVFDDLGDSTNDRLLKPRASVGESDSESNNAVSRLITKFRLPGGTEVAPFLERATLRFFLEDILGIPEGPVSLWHSIDDNDLELLPSDYEDESYADTSRDLVQATNAGQMYYELDVTDLVLADYAADGGDPLSAFRLQVNEVVFEDDDQGGRYRITMPGAEANHPELVLTFIPEPSTAGLSTLGLLGLIACGWRRRRQVD